MEASKEVEKPKFSGILGETDPMANSTVKNPKFTGIARSVECSKNNGYNNFRILTLKIKDGFVVSMDRSDPYASFDAMMRIQGANDISTLNLNDAWEHGKVWKK